MIRRKKCTIFTDVKENTTIYDVKKIVEGILKVPPENQRLFHDDTVGETVSFFILFSPKCFLDFVVIVLKLEENWNGKSALTRNLYIGKIWGVEL